ncbi:hypothetical protein [Caballeronia concitans]|nr:hypothetical protein [Caballeronia concitans]
MKSAEAYAKDRVANYVNQNVASTAVPSGVGTTVFATIDLGTAAYDFSRSENDKQRAYAGSRAALAAYALLGGPAAPVLAAVLLVASVVEAGLAARQQAEMLKIYKQIEEDYTRVIEIDRLMVQADAIQYRQLVATATGALAEYATNINGYKRNCGSESGVATLAELDNCVAMLGKALFAARLFVRTADVIKGWQERNEGTFAKVNSALGINLGFLLDARASADSFTSKVEPEFDKILSSFTQIAAKLIVDGALQKPGLTTAEWVQMDCIDEAMSHARAGTDILVRGMVLGARITKLEVNAYLRGVATFRKSICQKVAKAGLPAEHAEILTSWMKIVASTSQRVRITFPNK